MSQLTIQLDPVALREATTQAIMGILTPEVRAQILSDAIKALLTPSTDPWRRDKSPLQEAFDLAVRDVAREAARENVAADPGIKAKMTELMRGVADHLITMNTEQFMDRVADAVIASIRSER